ncbi:capsular biosynthesis protein [Helicobacter sp. MIT 11-5569]|uniref:glycosyltransferase n=1 Tax=Helicobacter sp. MIT 11-5569 TaxID=1548151 RepID=UPI0010FEF8EB|nr:glycosyltransferase [Helicobacter sp. MIT 11-5569]TLD81364.1 capsular biosynthesis protein [Helicobacter sp. MIT 11-5569]
MKKLLIFDFHDHSSNPRTYRGYKSLKGKYELFGLGYVAPVDSLVQFLTIPKPKWTLKMKLIQRFWLLFRRYEHVYWNLPQVKSAEEILKDKEFDIIIAHNEESLPLVLKYKKNAKVIVDMHEYAPKEFEHSFWWRFYFAPYKHYLCQTYLPKADYVYTVNQGFAEEYQKNYGIKCGVITSAAYYFAPPPQLFAQDSKNIKLIYHGIASPERGIEEMIKTMDYVDSRFSLDLMLVATYHQDYFQILKDMTENRKNVRIIPPVSFEEIIPFSSTYDIGFYILQPKNYNGFYALPNKFFEFIQARLAIAIGPNPEMARLVKQYNLGIISKDFTPESMAEELNKLTKEQILHYKENANQTAKILNAEREREKILGIIEEIL